MKGPSGSQNFLLGCSEGAKEIILEGTSVSPNPLTVRTVGHGDGGAMMQCSAISADCRPITEAYRKTKKWYSIRTLTMDIRHHKVPAGVH